MRVSIAALLPLLPGALGLDLGGLDSLVPLHHTDSPTAIPGEYVIVLKQGVQDLKIGGILSTIEQAAESFLRHNYSIPGFNGLGAKLSTVALSLLRLETDSIEYIAQSQLVQTATPTRRTKRLAEPDAPWGLARISGREKLSSRPASMQDTYGYDTRAGAGTTGYVIDTGIYVSHVEFGGRASWGTSFIPDNKNASKPQPPDCSGLNFLKNPQDCLFNPQGSGGKGDGMLYEDDNGHGTHCAGTLAGTSVGVAKNAHLVAVKALNGDGSGSTSDLIAALDWVYQDAKANNRLATSVVSMSIGALVFKPLNDAVEKLVGEGVPVVVAAGNANQDAANTSPASAPDAITVGASDVNDTRAAFSNYGAVVDLFAPGVNVKSAWNSGTTDYRTESGTSMATPHVAGLVLYLKSVYGNLTTPADVQKMLVSQLATKDALYLGNAPGTANLLAYNGFS